MSKETLRLAIEALNLAMENLRPHEDNCFLHDDGEYNRCFCGKDSLVNHLESVVESLEALTEQGEPMTDTDQINRGCWYKTDLSTTQPKQGEAVVWCTKSELEGMTKGLSQEVPARSMRIPRLYPEGSTVMLYTKPPQRTWVGLDDDEVLALAVRWSNSMFVTGAERFILDFAREYEEKLMENNK